MVKKLIDLYIDKIKNIQDLNIKLSNVLIEITSKLIKYSKKTNIELPYEIQPLLQQAYRYMHELKHPTITNKSCSVCNNLNPENADFCCYCGTSLVITRIRQDNKSPANETEPFFWYCVKLVCAF